MPGEVVDHSCQRRLESFFVIGEYAEQGTDPLQLVMGGVRECGDASGVGSLRFRQLYGERAGRVAHHAQRTTDHPMDVVDRLGSFLGDGQRGVAPEDQLPQVLAFDRLAERRRQAFE